MFTAIIVDDEKRIRDGMKKLINWEEHGFVIIGQACDGTEALDMCRREKPDLVITDIKMPRMDGLMLSCELRKMDTRIRIIILSGYNDFTYAKQALKCGVSDYLLKPVNKAELCKELNSIRCNLLSMLSQDKEVIQDTVQLKNMFLTTLINGDISCEEAVIDPSNRSIGIENAKSMCVNILYTDGCLCENGKKSEPDISLKISMLRELLEELFSTTKTKHFCEYAKGRFCILVLSPDVPLKTEQLVEGAQEIINTVKKRCNIDAIISVGDIVTSVEDLKASYNSAASLLEMGTGVFRSENVLYSLPPKSSADIVKILMYINKHYAEELNLKKLAGIFYINPAYLGQILKKKTGKYFYELLNKIRVENSKKLLRENIYAIQRISEIVGYKSTNHYCKHFKAIVGQNPADYRKHVIQQMK